MLRAGSGTILVAFWGIDMKAKRSNGGKLLCHNCGRPAVKGARAKNRRGESWRCDSCMARNASDAVAPPKKEGKK